MVYHSLTEAPHNLKEGIDWLVALKGTNAEGNLKALGTAVHKFLVNKPVGFTEVPALENIKLVTKKFLEQTELDDQWFVKELLKRYNKPINTKPGIMAKYFRAADECDYKNVVTAKRISAKTIAGKLGMVVGFCERFLDHIKVPNQYQSAYSSEATWDASCTKDPEACAIVFVGIAPMLYGGLGSLQSATIADSLKHLPFAPKKSFGNVLKALGYVEPGCRDSLSGSDVGSALRGLCLRTLVTLCDLAGFWAFYGSKNPEAVDPVEQPAEPIKPVEPAKPVTTSDAVEALKYSTGKDGTHHVAGGNSGVDMGLLHAWNAKKSNKPPKIYTGVGSNNFHVPGAPAVANLDYGSLI
ncbi:hypothetical protein, conserved [Babesia ovata]|uniref:Uncharacterized protein n=1 Tax=Babesia ovata TaxID=189622 RepID=A0A2H6KDL3_9APIC|nr:uncharacterized protein BOVATA_025830 [Babesia ovata]GBE61090.1 hypothetical protein, conserved [Babesia ovata]